MISRFVCLLFCIAAIAPARAQSAPIERDDRSADSSVDAGGEGTVSDDADTGVFGNLLANPFLSSREDFGPLQPGEQEKLLEFVRAHTPRIAEMLTRLQKQNPNRFDERMHDLAPRLRRLARLYENSPDLGEKLLRHADNLDGIKRKLRGLPPGDDTAPPRRRALDDARRLVRENIEIEAGVMEARIQTLRERRDALIDQEFRRLTSDSVRVGKLPTELRPTIRSYLAAKPGPVRDASAASIRSTIERSLDHSIEQLTAQAAKLRGSAANEAEARLSALRDQSQPAVPRKPAARP